MIQTIEDRLKHVYNLAQALNRLSIRGVIPQQICYHEHTEPSIVVSLEDLKLLADGRPVERREDSMITYSSKWDDFHNVALIAYVFNAERKEPTTVQL